MNAVSDTSRYEVDYEYTVTNILDARRLSQSPLHRIVGITAAVIFIVGALLAALGGATGWIDLVVGVYVMLLGFLLLALVSTRVLESWAVRRAAGPILGKPAFFVLSEEGITGRTPIASSTTPWSSMTGVRWNDDTLIALNDRILVWFAPVSALGTSEQRAEIIAFMQRRIVEGYLAAGRRPPGAKYKVVG